MSSVADWCVVPMQDWLGLGSESRMNVPGTAAGNWRWRLLPGEASETLAGEIRAMTRRYGRLGEGESKT
jgi:4-alpha-glucanotransferase